MSANQNKSHYGNLACERFRVGSLDGNIICAKKKKGLGIKGGNLVLGAVLRCFRVIQWASEKTW